MRSSVGFPSLPSSSSSSTQTHSHSAWHSPVPYLFGGLAAMLGLIAFALLILACSYWKLSGFLDGGDDAGDVESGEGNGEKTATDVKPMQDYYEQRIVVIMAGDEKPTFLATPISSRASSFGDNGGRVNGEGNGAHDGEVEEKERESLNTVQEEGNDESNQGQEP